MYMALDPFPMLFGPGFHPFRPAPMSQQKLSQAVASL